MGADRCDLALRIVIVDPVPGVTLMLQRGKGDPADLVAPSSVLGDGVAFDFPVVVAPPIAGEGPRLLGPFVQGPPDKRFVYLCVGRYAGDPASPWAGRTKIPLTGLTWPLVDAVKSGGRLEARILGRARNGSPSFASTALLPPGWRAIQR
jgi:hypothetical protein